MDEARQTVTDSVHAPKRRGRPPGSKRSKTIELHRQIIGCTKNGQGMSRSEIAEKLECDRRTVASVLDKYGIKLQEVEEFRENRADIFAGKQAEILNALTPVKLQNASVKDLTIALGTIYDKERLESGQSTANVANLHSIASRAIKALNKAADSPSATD